MANLIAQIIHTLSSSSRRDALDEALLQAAFLFEKARGLEPCGWPDEVVGADLTPGELCRLKQAVVDFVERAGFGSWSLSKCEDPSLKPVFIRALQRNVGGDPHEMFNAMLALSGLGEDIFEGRRSMCVTETTANRDLAIKYLKRCS